MLRIRPIRLLLDACFLFDCNKAGGDVICAYSLISRAKVTNFR